MVRDERLALVEIAASFGMSHGPIDVAIGREPRRCVHMDLAPPVDVGASEFARQPPGEQRMHAVPLVPAVEGRDDHAGALHASQQWARAEPAKDPVAHRAGEAF